MSESFLKPLIGLTVDSSEDTFYSDYPWYALRKNYCENIVQAGGLPLMIPHQIDLIDYYLDILDGVIVTGGNFDHDPQMYNESYQHPKTHLNLERSIFDFAIVQRTLERDLPFLGICAGQQMLNIVRGGSLVQFIPDELPHGLNHSQEESRHLPTHPLHIVEKSLLMQCNKGKKDACVNTSHQQAVKDLGAGLMVSAMASDGVIEGIEDPSKAFCLGVQWHPEFLVCDLDREIYRHFIAAARTYKMT